MKFCFHTKATPGIARSQIARPGCLPGVEALAFPGMPTLEDGENRPGSQFFGIPVTDSVIVTVSETRLKPAIARSLILLKRSRIRFAAGGRALHVGSAEIASRRRGGVCKVFANRF